MLLPYHALANAKMAFLFYFRKDLVILVFLEMKINFVAKLRKKNAKQKIFKAIEQSCTPFNLDNIIRHSDLILCKISLVCKLIFSTNLMTN